METYKEYLKNHKRFDIGKIKLPTAKEAVEYMKQNHAGILEALKDK